jgi:hypothetical protein
MPYYSSSPDDSEFEDSVIISAIHQGHPTKLTRKEISEDGSDNDSESENESGGGISITSKKNSNGNGDSSADDAKAKTSKACGYIAPSNWKKVKTRPGQKIYWANEVTGATSWDQPPPDVQYHKPLPNRSTITSYGFTKQSRKDP